MFLIDSPHPIRLTAPDLTGSSAKSKPPLWVFAVLATFDLSGTAIGGVGLQWVDASVNQMLRGSGVVFTAFASILLLQRRLRIKQWYVCIYPTIGWCPCSSQSESTDRYRLCFFVGFFFLSHFSHACRGGIVIVCLGLVCVGLSGFLREKYSSGTHRRLSFFGFIAHTDALTLRWLCCAGSAASSNVSPMKVLLGIALVLAGTALNAVQGVLEEKLMKAVGGAEVHPLELVGWEGVFGLIFSAYILLPVVHWLPGPNCGSVENLFDTLYMVQQPFVFALIGIFIVALMIMNYLSQQISKVLSAVHRQLISSIRTLIVWTVEILLYYVLHMHAYGEAFDLWSIIQLGGFVCLVAGTFFYGRAKEAEQQMLPVDSTLSQ